MDTQTPEPADPRPTEPGPAPTSYGAPAAPPRPAPAGEQSGFFASVRRTGLFRSDERWIGGVAGGLAARFGIDPLLVRGILGVSILLGGLGMLVYGIGWALLPEQRDGRIHLQEMIRGRFDAALLGALALVIVGLNRNDQWFGWWGDQGLGWVKGLLWLGVIVVVVVLIAKAASNRTPPRPPAMPAYGPPTGPAYPSPVDDASQATAYGAPSTTTSPYGMPSTGTSAPGATAYPYPTAPYPAAPYPATGPAGAGQPVFSGYGGPVPPPPPSPVAIKTRPPGPGSTTFGIVGALVLLTFAVLLGVERSGDFTGSVWVTGGAVAVVLLGLAVMVSAVRGRRSGGLGALAVVGVLLTLPLVADHEHDWTWDDGPDVVVSTNDHTVTQRGVAEEGYQLGLGDSTIDLSAVELTDETLRVPIEMGAGSLVVVVPEGVSVVADVELGAGDIAWEVDDPTERTGGVGLGNRTYTSDEVVDGSEPQLALDISLGAGDITIKENR
jgi:phage shock protein PspC (stress-responsive transcriptional regulator)